MDTETTSTNCKHCGARGHTAEEARRGSLERDITTSSLTHQAFIAVEPDPEFNVYGDVTHHPVEIIGHRESDWGRQARVKHLGPIPTMALRVHWIDAEDIVIEAVAR